MWSAHHLVAVLSASLVIGTVLSLSPECVGPNNTIPLWVGEPALVAQVPNGKLYRAGGVNDTFAVLHVWGTPYQQGYAQGQLMKSTLSTIEARLIAFIESEAQGQVPNWLPQWLVDAVIQYGAPYLLELTYNLTSPFAPQRYLDEMQGIADGAGVPVSSIRNFNMFPELTKAACTIVGATGSATHNGQIAHLRALDFNARAPMVDFPQVTVYHDAEGPVLANVGWTGMIGVLTGLSNTTIGIGEKVWINHPAGIDAVTGEPWMFVLRDALAARNMDDALSRIQRANRTCAIHVGIGDSTTNTFNGLTIAARAYDVYNWTSLNWTGHPIITDVFYWDKHAQPSSDPCLGELLQEYWGTLDAETLALNVATPFKTGDTHCVTFDYKNDVAFIANARKSNQTDGHLKAYNRQFARLDLSLLWNESPPTAV